HISIAGSVVFMNSEKNLSSPYNHSFLPVLAATYHTREMGVALHGLQVRVIRNGRAVAFLIWDVSVFLS
ncbi:hypothetical protein ACSQSN_005012, partial [Escherichia coli]